MLASPAVATFLRLPGLEMTKQKTKKAVVTEALQEYIQRHKQMKILDLFGKVDIDSDYDYKKQRQLK